MIINGIDCITYAHGFTHDKILDHEYFGTDKIVDDFKKMQGWDQGYIRLSPNPMRRNPLTGLVIKIVQEDI